MKGFALTHPGFLDTCAQELEELGAKARVEEDVVAFEAEPEDVIRIIYRAQAPMRFMLDGIHARCSTQEDVLSLVRQYDATAWLPGATTFKVDGIMEHLPRSDVTAAAGAVLQQKIKLKVDLSSPDLPFFLYVTKDHAYFGFDPVGDISKRSYKIFHAPSTIKGTLAYCFLRWAGYNGKGSLLDPCAGSGVIPIEAALFATHRSPRFFQKDTLRLTRYAPFPGLNEETVYAAEDAKIGPCPPIYSFDNQLPQVKATQKNAKIAGVDKALTCTKLDVEWLDIKLQKEEIGYLATQPPTDLKFYDELFYQAAFVLKAHGVIALLVRKENARIAAEKHGFSCSVRQSGEWLALRCEKK
ncbi:hypothetical protein HY639_05625 [Candidatus Woesearchaeota archaeon]|nr:hypothetical protein [Candidatus Woesearchaeota archaeon]